MWVAIGVGLPPTMIYAFVPADLLHVRRKREDKGGEGKSVWSPPPHLSVLTPNPQCQTIEKRLGSLVEKLVGEIGLSGEK